MDKQIRLDWILILSFLIPFLIYLKTLLPTVGFWDTGEFQTIPYTFDVGHPTGYPTYVLLGKIYLSIFPFGSVALRMNLFSALSVSLGLFIFSLLLKRLTNSHNISILIPILLSVNPYLWSVAIRADPHALNFLFTSIFLFLSHIIIKNKNISYLPLICFLTGLAIGNHMLSIFLIPPLILIFLFLIRKIKIDKSYLTILLSAQMFIVGLSVYCILPIISSTKTSFTIDYTLTTFDGFKRHVFGQDFKNMMSGWLKNNFIDSISFYYDLFKNSFPLHSWFLIILGLTTFKRKDFIFNLMCMILFLSTSLFSLRYQNAIIERYFLTSFLISSIWLSLFIVRLTKRRKAFIVKYFINIYLVLCIFSSFHNNFVKIDESKNFYAKEWAQQTLSSVKQNSIIYSWWSYSTPLWYMQKVEHSRDDVTIVNTGANNWESKSSELVNYNDIYFVQEIDLNDTNLQLEQVGNLYKLIKLSN